MLKIKKIYKNRDNAMMQLSNYNLFLSKILIATFLLYVSPLELRSRQMDQQPSPVPLVEQEKEKLIPEKEEKSKNEIISNSKNMVTPLSQPSFLTGIYLAIAPIILVTLNKALGTGIAASTKSLIKQFIQRGTIMSQKENIIVVNAQSLIKKGNIDATLKQIAKENPSFNISAVSYEQKFDLAKNIAKTDFETQAEAISLQNILGQAILIGTINTIIPMIGSLIGIGATMTLQSLMPASNDTD
jgi:hypothetical protein